MSWNGRTVRVESPEQARRLGIAMVFQHFSLFEMLTVAENVWLGLPEKSRARVAARIREVGQSYGLELDPERPVHTLSVGERQRVEIVRALLSNPQLLILDEPTSVLTPQAIERLFETLRRLAKDGCSILYISHKLDEIRALCQRCTVLRAGKVTGHVQDPASETNASLSRLMLGAEPPALEHHERRPGALVLEVSGLTLPKQDEFGVSLDGVSFSVAAGEVLGVAGVSGNGQSELLAALSGEDRRAASNAIQLSGRDISTAAPERRRRLGLHYVPEERLGRATVPVHSLSENTLLTRKDSVASRGLAAPGAAARAGAQHHRALSRQSAGSGHAGAQLVGWQSAEIRGRARDRRAAQVAHRGSADLGRGRGGRRADPKRAPRAARRRVGVARRQ